MESTIVRNLQPEFSPVAVVWSNTIPDDALQFKKGKFGCILYLFAEAARRGKVAGGNRESITCNGGRAALGLGVDGRCNGDRARDSSQVDRAGGCPRRLPCVFDSAQSVRADLMLSSEALRKQ